MKGLTLLARVGIPVTRRPGYLRVSQNWRWFEIKKGKRNWIYCSCRGAVHKHQQALQQAFAPDTCDHVKALYEGRATENWRNRALQYYTDPILGVRVSASYRAIFTPQGNELFDWRRAALALMRDS